LELTYTVAIKIIRFESKIIRIAL